MAGAVYIETSVIGYLTVRPGKDAVTLVRRDITRNWWEHCRENFELFISSLVVKEISAGDPDAARERLKAVLGMRSLDASDQALAIAEKLLQSRAVPSNSAADAAHIGIAAAEGAEFLLTWNFKHINNAQTKVAIERVVEQEGFVCPVLCSPEELGGEP